MACFVVPATEAIVVTGAYFIAKHNEKKNISVENANKEPLSKKLLSLDGLLIGGSTLLAFEHLWHGEIIPTFPFLTAVTEGKDAIQTMLYEMGTAGVAMAVLCTAVWGISLLVKAFKKKQNIVVETK